MRKSSGKLAILLLSAAMAAVPCVSAQASSLTAVMNAHKAMLDGPLKDIYTVLSDYITAEAARDNNGNNKILP